MPDKPAPVVLKGKYIRLEPLVIERDAEKLFAISNGNAIHLGEKKMEAYDADALIWHYMLEGPFDNIEDFKANLQQKLDFTTGLCFCSYDAASNHPVGVITYINNCPAYLKIEFYGWYSPIVHHTHTSTETDYLLLKHAFDLGYQRVEWKCSTLNERSRKAALRLGFKFEGIHECDMIVKRCSRDTAFYRILSKEWPEVKKKLEEILYP